MRGKTSNYLIILVFVLIVVASGCTTAPSDNNELEKENESISNQDENDGTQNQKESDRNDSNGEDKQDRTVNLEQTTISEEDFNFPKGTSKQGIDNLSLVLLNHQENLAGVSEFREERRIKYPNGHPQQEEGQVNIRLTDRKDEKIINKLTSLNGDLYNGYYYQQNESKGYTLNFPSEPGNSSVTTWEYISEKRIRSREIKNGSLDFWYYDNTDIKLGSMGEVYIPDDVETDLEGIYKVNGNNVAKFIFEKQEISPRYEHGTLNGGYILLREDSTILKLNLDITPPDIVRGKGIRSNFTYVYHKEDELEIEKPKFSN